MSGRPRCTFSKISIRSLTHSATFLIFRLTSTFPSLNTASNTSARKSKIPVVPENAREDMPAERDAEGKGVDSDAIPNTARQLIHVGSNGAGSACALESNIRVESKLCLTHTPWMRSFPGLSPSMTFCGLMSTREWKQLGTHWAWVRPV